jgi:protein TonB
MWERPSFESSLETEALKQLLEAIKSADARERYVLSLRRAREDERRMREMFIANISAPVIEEAPEEESASAKGLRLPAPYRRLRPAYPDAARRAEVEATVDVLADIDSAGEVMRTEVARWAGFGLDEASVDTVRRMHFRPAMRDGVAIPMRVLLRYNFRKPPKEK